MLLDVFMPVSKAVAVSSTVGLAVLAQAPDPIQSGKTLGSFTAAEVLGVVSVVAVIALVLLYRDSRKDNARLYTVIEENTKACQKTADALDQNMGILVEVKEAIIKCNGPVRQK